MKFYQYLPFFFLFWLAACSSDNEDGSNELYRQMQPLITVKDTPAGNISKAGSGGGGSTYFSVGEHVGFLLVDHTTNGLYSDTKNIGVLRYTFDGKNWTTEDSYVLTGGFARVYSFYPYNASDDHSYDGVWPNSYRSIETSSNTDYLWGISKYTAGNPGINAKAPQVHVQMSHVLCRVSFQLKRAIAYDPSANIGKGSVTAFSAKGVDAGGNSMHGTSKYCFITGEVQRPVTADKNPVHFSTLAGHSIPTDLNSTLGGSSEFMSMVPGKVSMKVNMNIDGQSYQVTVPQMDYVAGNHYLITLVYKGSQVELAPDTGTQGGSMEIIPWASGGNIGVKSLSNKN